MRILNPAFQGYMKLRNSAIDNFLYHPLETQTKVFNNLIANAQYTEFGKKYNFENVNTVKEFKNTVPINDYDTLKPYIQKILDGEQNILWNTDITWFAKSSGTTSDKSKFIPVSKEALDGCHYKAGLDVLALYYRNIPNCTLLGGKGVALGGSHQVNQLNAESFYGDLSAVMLQNMSSLGHYMSSLDLNIALMAEWEEKIEKMAHYTINEDITFLAGVPTWTIVLIKKIFEITGKTNLMEVWPNLQLYIHGGVSFTPYKAQFEKLIPNANMKYLETYNASEGFFAAQDLLDEDNGMLLFLNHGIYYEFMPVEENGKEFPTTLELDEVELEKNYAIIVSTNGGLWRYLVGDTIQFTSLHPFRIKVSGRLKFFINAFGEEIIVENADYAISKASAATHAIVNDYSAAPVFFSDNESGAHEWVIEFETPPNDMENFITLLDESLKEINSDYEAKRHKSIALRKPIVHIMPKGGFNNWLKSKGKLGGQHKVPRLCNDRTYIDDIIAFAKK